MAIYKLELTGEELHAARIAIMRMADRYDESDKPADKARANFLDNIYGKLCQVAFEQKLKYEE